MMPDNDQKPIPETVNGCMLAEYQTLADKRGREIERSQSSLVEPSRWLGGGVCKGRSKATSTR